MIGSSTRVRSVARSREGSSVEAFDGMSSSSVVGGLQFGWEFVPSGVVCGAGVEWGNKSIVVKVPRRAGV